MNPVAKPKHELRRYVPFVGGTLIVLALLGGLAKFIAGMLSYVGPPPKPRVQQITLVPIPPPTPPKLEEPPPEEIKEIDLPEPEPLPEQAENEPPPGEDLGVDADGGAGGDAFGLLGKKGERSLVGSGGSRFGRFATLLQQELHSYLTERSELRSGSYSVIVKLWISGGGQVERVELVGSTGDRKTDESLRLALADGVRLNQAPPEDMPQPVRIRISSRT